MSARPRTVVVVAAALAATAGCQSTSEKAAELRARAVEVEVPKALAVAETAAIRTEVLAVLNTEGVGTAVVIALTNTDPKRSVVWAPIDVTLRGADGAVVSRNNEAGANSLLVRVPSLPAGGRSFYVNDQFIAEAPAKTAKVTLGGELLPLPAPPGALQVRGAKIVDDPIGGQAWTGTVTNTTPVVQQAVILQALARRGGKIVAAGTSVVEPLKPGASAPFTGYFIGDPTGGRLTVLAPASNVQGAKGAPPPSADETTPGSIEDTAPAVADTAPPPATTP